MKKWQKVATAAIVVLALLSAYEIAIEQVSGGSLVLVNSAGLAGVLVGIVVAAVFLRRASPA